MTQQVERQRCRVLFAAVYPYRSTHFVGAFMGFALIVTGICAWRQMGLWALIFIAGGTPFLLIAGRWWILDKTWRFEIRTDGILVASQPLVPWEEVTRVSANGTPQSRGVSLFYMKKGSGRYYELSSPRTPLTQDGYSDLIASLQGELLDKYPALTLGGFARIPG